MKSSLENLKPSEYLASIEYTCRYYNVYYFQRYQALSFLLLLGLVGRILEATSLFELIFIILFIIFLLALIIKKRAQSRMAAILEWDVRDYATDFYDGFETYGWTGFQNRDGKNICFDLIPIFNKRINILSYLILGTFGNEFYKTVQRDLDGICLEINLPELKEFINLKRDE